MEFCIEVLVRPGELDPRLMREEPTETAWGLTDVDPNKYWWERDIVVRDVPVIDSLKKYLPESVRDTEWRCLTIFGRAVDDFQNDWVEGEKLSDLCDHSLVRLIRLFLNHSPEWLFFYVRDCDRIRDVYRHTVDEVIDEIIRARAPGTDCGGFCSISSSIK